MFLGKGVLKICSKFTGEHPCRSVISIKLQSSFIEIIFWYGCSPVNFLHIFRTPFHRTPLGGCFWRISLIIFINLWVRNRQSSKHVFPFKSDNCLRKLTSRTLRKLQEQVNDWHTKKLFINTSSFLVKKFSCFFKNWTVFLIKIYLAPETFPNCWKNIPGYLLGHILSWFTVFFMKDLHQKFGRCFGRNPGAAHFEEILCRPVSNRDIFRTHIQIIVRVLNMSLINQCVDFKKISS